MARYEHLPLFQTSYSYLKEIHRMRVNLPKVLKHDLGHQIFASSLRCLRLIVLANGQQRKDQTLTELAIEIEQQWIYLRLLHDFKGISAGLFKELSTRLADMSPQVNAWRAWEKRRIKAEEDVAEGSTRAPKSGTTKPAAKASVKKVTPRQGDFRP